MMLDTAPEPDAIYNRAVAKEYRWVFRQYKELSDLPTIERIGWIAGFSICEDDEINDRKQTLARSAIEQQDWSALSKMRSWKITEDDLSYFAVQCDGVIHCVVEIYDRYEFTIRDKILWHSRCGTDQTERILPLVTSWEYLINPDPCPSLFTRFLDMINWQW
jgi:hypothetical protein